MMKKLGNVVSKALCVVCALFMLWCFASWVDVVADNCEPNPVHAEWNIFVLMTKDME